MSPSRLESYVLGLASILAVMVLYAPWLADPHIRYDDFNFLTKSRTIGDTRANVWEPMNEHVMPLARLASGVLMQVVPGQTAIPAATQIQGVLAVAIGMWLLYEFVRRELGHPFYGLLAMTLWGVTSTYYECVTWYSASFFILALDMALLGLLAAQRYRRTGGRSALAGSAVASALAPAFHSTALLAGAWCALYLLVGGRSRRSMAVVPLLGSLIFVGVSLATSAGEILRAEHYRGKTIFASFDLVQGGQNTMRTLVDNQLPGIIGIWDRHSTHGWEVVLPAIAVLVVIAALWWRVAPGRRLLALGTAVAIGSDLVVYSARADWSYDRSVHNWTRYHLFPHLGLVLFFVGGLPALEGRRTFTLAASGHLSRRQVLAVAVLIVGMVACHWPRTRQAYYLAPPEQREVLQRVERVDVRCRSARIAGETAREALGFLQFPMGFQGNNAWEFLQCSSSPVPLSLHEARDRLRDEQ